MSCVFCETVVIFGVLCSAAMMLSIPTTDSSCGTLRPSAIAAERKPMASRSSEQTAAVMSDAASS